MSLAFRRTSIDFVKDFKGANNLAEIYGKESMPEFAIISPEGQQIGPWMKCKDYIQDVIWGAHHGLAYQIYGFSYDPKKDPAPSKRYLLLGMRWKGHEKNMERYLENTKATVEELEKRLNIPKYKRTRFSRVRNGLFVIYGSCEWLRCIATVSFFTWLIRASLLNDGKSIDKISKMAVANDEYYKKSGNKFIKKLLDKGLAAFESDWDKFKDSNKVGSVHNNGFVTYSMK